MEDKLENHGRQTEKHNERKNLDKEDKPRHRQSKTNLDGQKEGKLKQMLHKLIHIGRQN